MNSFFHLGVGLVLRKGGVDSRWNLTRMPMHHYAIRMSLISWRIIGIYPLLGLSFSSGTTGKASLALLDALFFRITIQGDAPKRQRASFALIEASAAT